MTIEELIEKLQKLQEQCPGYEVRVYDSHEGTYDSIQVVGRVESPRTGGFMFIGVI